jgi:uncharacterized integral membrane protein
MRRDGFAELASAVCGWVGLITAAVFLILLVVFIAQNTAKASIHFLGFKGTCRLA